VGDWWLRCVLVLSSPRAVFVALRDEEDASDRSEPVLLIVLLAGIAFVLSTSTAAHLMDPEGGNYDGMLVAVWVFLAGSLYGGIAYWVLGGVLHGASVALGSQGSYRRSRHVLAFAAVPVVLSLVLWLLKLALWGGDLFRTGGGDSGDGGKVFAALSVGLLAWSVCLLVIGVRSVHGWTWARAAAASVAPVALAAIVLLV